MAGAFERVAAPWGGASLGAPFASPHTRTARAAGPRRAKRARLFGVILVKPDKIAESHR